MGFFLSDLQNCSKQKYTDVSARLNFYLIPNFELYQGASIGIYQITDEPVLLKLKTLKHHKWCFSH